MGCRCTLITQHFHFSLVNLILRLTRVFKIFAEKCFQSIKSLAWRISRSPLESRENKIPFSFSSRKWRIIKKISLSPLEIGEYFFKFLFLFSIGLFCLSLLSV